MHTQSTLVVFEQDTDFVRYGEEGGLSEPLAHPMRPAVLASLQPSRLSASRSLLERARRGRWQFHRARFDIDADGAGEAIYRVQAEGRTIDLVVLANAPRRDRRTSRIIGNAWDMRAALIEGPVTQEQIEITRREMPKLYRGRGCVGTLVWCRANRSLRVFDYVVERLAAGRQPDVRVLAHAGYLVRNTGLDANGTFGTKPLFAYHPDHPLVTPFHPQMLAAYLMRQFSIDLVSHLARRANPTAAATLDPAVARYLGLGNGSGLGLVLWVNNHPRVVDRWLTVREEARAAVMEQMLTPTDVDRLRQQLSAYRTYRAQDAMLYHVIESSERIAGDLELVLDALPSGADGPVGVRELVARMPAQVSVSTSDTVLSSLFDVLPRVVPSAPDLLVNETLVDDPAMTLRQLAQLVRRDYAWALEYDLVAPSRPFVWYRSRIGEEPRRGPRDEVDDGVHNLALDLPGQIQQLIGLIDAADRELEVGRFLRHQPDQRDIVARVQALRGARLHSPEMDMLAADFHPSQVIAFVNVAMFGLTRARDALDRNILALMFHGAPTIDELNLQAVNDDWFAPALPHHPGDWRPLTRTGQR